MGLEVDGTFFHRRLCSAVLCPDFDRISTMNHMAAVTEKFHTCHKDHGASYYFNHTKPQPLYRDRPSLVAYICHLSSKLSYLAGLLHQICVTNLRKVIVFCDWPSASWLVEVLVLLLDFNVLSIRARDKLVERKEAVVAFNDPNNPVQPHVQD